MNRTAAVITISDKGFKGQREDTSGPALCQLLEAEGFQVVRRVLLPDEKEQIQAELLNCSDQLGISLILTTGGTGFSPRDVTPEAALAVIERQTPGIPEAMRAESMRITPKGCLSRSVAGIRRRSLIITLPGSEKAARENLLAVLEPVKHGLDMMLSAGSADCGERSAEPEPFLKKAPSMDTWMQEAKAHENAGQCGMYLFHNGVVRETAKAKVREGKTDTRMVTGMMFSFDAEKTEDAIAAAYQLPGIYYVRVWLAEGVLSVGDDIMLVLVGGDIRPHVVDALQKLVEILKNECVKEREIF